AGPLADLNEAERKQAVENHYQWVDAAKFLGCHSIRVNLRGKGTADEAGRASIESLGRLSEYGAKNKIGVIVENHGGYSSDIKWLTTIIRQVNNPYCGTLPDFGNFCIENVDKKCINEYDRYLGVQEMLPYAKGISAKSLDFDEKGDETKIDFLRMFKMIKKEKPASFKGFVGIEYSGSVLSEDEGIRKTKQLLEKVGQMIS
ncbi:MAG TPA: TIM barrel protein, partial [Flavitalea sp.]|nr:TIM barrel protein [Flavitalea sp.]